MLNVFGLKRRKTVACDQHQALYNANAEALARITRLEKSYEELKHGQSELRGSDDALTSSVAQLQIAAAFVPQFFARQNEINALQLQISTESVKAVDKRKVA